MNELTPKLPKKSAGNGADRFVVTPAIVYDMLVIAQFDVGAFTVTSVIHVVGLTLPVYGVGQVTNSGAAILNMFL